MCCDVKGAVRWMSVGCASDVLSSGWYIQGNTADYYSKEPCNVQIFFCPVCGKNLKVEK